GEPCDSDADIIFTFLGKSQTQAVGSFSVDIKRLTDHVGDVRLLETGVKNLFAILILRQSHPQKESASRLCPTDTGRHEPLQRLQHDLTSRLIESTNLRQMFLDNASLPAFGHNALVQHAATQIG